MAHRLFLDIQVNPEEAKDILISKLELNPEIKELIVLPTYHETRVPTEAYLKEVEDWTEALQGNVLDLNYNDVVTTQFVAQ